MVSVADLPGLIEGAHMNRGMGHNFLKHVERTKQIMFVVDVCGFQLANKTPFRSAFEAVQLLTKELNLYKEELSKPAILVVNKMDLPEAEEKLRELETQLENQEDLSHLLPKDIQPKSFLHFKHCIPVSALTGLGLSHLKAAIRKSLKEQEAIESERHRIEKLEMLRRKIPVVSKPTWGQTHSEP